MLNEYSGIEGFHSVESAVVMLREDAGQREAIARLLREHAVRDLDGRLTWEDRLRIAQTMKCMEAAP